jgi:hypothetical protein
MLARRNSLSHRELRSGDYPVYYRLHSNRKKASDGTKKSDCAIRIGRIGRNVDRGLPSFSNDCGRGPGFRVLNILKWRTIRLRLGRLGPHMLYLSDARPYGLELAPRKSSRSSFFKLSAGGPDDHRTTFWRKSLQSPVQVNIGHLRYSLIGLALVPIRVT